MKLTKTDAQKKGKKAKYTAKVKRTDTKKEVKVSRPTSDKTGKEVLEAVKSLALQNKDLMSFLKSSDNSEVMFKHIGDLVVGLRDLSLKDFQDANMALLQRAERKKKWVAKITKRDTQGFIDTFTFEQEFEPLN